jgi:hypothetical protein
VVLSGSYFGPVNAVQVVTFGPASGGAPQYTAQCSRGADLGPGLETLQCVAPPGVGTGLLWTVSVEGQACPAFPQATAYRRPTITTITGVGVAAFTVFLAMRQVLCKAAWHVLP